MTIEPILLPRVKLEDFLAKHGLKLVVRESRDGDFEASIPTLGKAFRGQYGSVVYDPVCGDGDSPHEAIEDVCDSVDGARLAIIRQNTARRWWAFWQHDEEVEDLGRVVLLP